MMAVLFCATYGSVAGGCISGTACGMMMSLAGGASGYFPISYAFSGLVAGCFSPLGRFGSTAFFVLANGVAVLAVTTAPITALYETLIATALFLLIPQQWLENAAKPFFAVPPADPSADSLRRSVVMRLDFASKAIAQVSQSVEELSRKLLKKGKSSVSGVYDSAVEETCWQAFPGIPKPRDRRTSQTPESRFQPPAHDYAGFFPVRRSAFHKRCV